ncbi:MAG TPA: hypothetical protein PK685_03685 [archaeon]|jgi:hypothetical protein|nr:hypothetical protein [archaeon]
MKPKNKKLTKDEIFSIFIAIFLIFTTLLNAWFSAGVAIGALITVFIYKFNKE